MNSWQMTCFDTVARTLNFSKASKELYISQQALSKHVQKLEKDLGVQLLVRSPKVELTKAGEIVHEAVKQMLTTERKMNQHLKYLDSSKEMVSLGMGYTRNRNMLMTFFPWFKSAYPEIDLQITLDTARNLQDLLLNGRIDFWIGYMAEQNENLEHADLFEDPMIFLVPKQLLPENWDITVNPLSVSANGYEPSRLPIMLLPRGHTIRTNVEAYIRGFGITPNVILENNDNETLLMLGLDGIGSLFAAKTLVDRYADHPRMKNMLRFNVTTALVPQRVSVIYRKNTAFSKAQSDFLAACLERLKEHK